MSRTTDMILELSRSNITPDSNLLIKYGNGSLNVNLALLLPCSDSDFKRLTAFIDKIDDYTDTEAAVGFIWRYVFAMNTELNRIKETYPAGDTKSRAECQKLINRFEKYMQVLTDKYSYMLPDAETEKTPEKRQRAKSADIYTLSVNTRAAYAEPEIKVYSGKIITAVDGMQYGIYKADKGLYKIIDIYTGLSVGASAHSVAECKEVLTVELCARVAECRTKDNYKIYLSNFAAAMTAAGYADYIIPYTAADPEPATAATAAGIAPAHYITAFSLSMADYIHIYRAGADMSHRTRQSAPRHITAALYPDPAIIAGIPPALYNMPRRNKTASALLYSTPAYMRHRRHAARINAIYRAPPALKRLRQRIRGMIDSEKPPARYYRISARRQNNQIYISWRRSIIRQNMRGYIDNMAPECRTPERQQAIKRARTRQNGAGYIWQCRSTRAAARQ